VRILSQALTSEEIEAAYEAGRRDVNCSGTVGWPQMDKTVDTARMTTIPDFTTLMAKYAV
jgi:hypothetical protein